MPFRTRTTLTLLILSACHRKESEPPPTYNRDVAPIVDSRCVSCHVEGGIAPFSLEGYQNVSRYADLVADAVEDRRMPPGQADDDCQTYLFGPSLSEDEIASIVSWAEGGAEEGDAADAVETEVAVDPEALDRVDFEVEMPEPYTPTTVPDDYRCFPVEWPMEEETFVTGFGVDADATEMVHHVILYVIPPNNREPYEELDAAEDGPGYTCFGGAGVDDIANKPQWLGGWVPGQEGRNMPAGSGIAVEPGSLLIMQVHYYIPDGVMGADQSSMLLKVDESVEYEGITMPFADPNWVLGGDMLIPAGAEGVQFSYTRELTSDMRLHDVGMHMHTHGNSGGIMVNHADGSETCALQIDDWDFHWQRSYRFEEPLEVAAGTTLTVTCDFTNDTDADLNWGESTEDEMCMGITYLTYAE